MPLMKAHLFRVSSLVLCNLRKNLRKVLILSILDEYKKESDLFSFLDSKSNLSTIEKGIKREVNDNLETLTNSFSKSFLNGCSYGSFCIKYVKSVRDDATCSYRDWRERSSADIDYVWVPYLNSWICIECFNKHIATIDLSGWLKMNASQNVEISHPPLSALHYNEREIKEARELMQKNQL